MRCGGLEWERVILDNMIMPLGACVNHTERNCFVGVYQSALHVKPQDIEHASLRIIGAELRELGFEKNEWSDLEYQIVKRVIHTTADFDFAQTLAFYHDSAHKGREALLSGCSLVTDTNMVKTGISKPACETLGCHTYCYMADPLIAEHAKREEITRAAASMRHAIAEHPGAIFAVGNAPTALMELYDLIQEGAPRPALIVAVPVGFVNVVESKRLIAQLEVPSIVAHGRKGGSPVAVAILNALLYSCYDRELQSAKSDMRTI